MEYVERTYRNSFRQTDLVHFQIEYKETDLDIGVPAAFATPALKTKALELAKRYRNQLDAYIKLDPDFATTLKPHGVLPGAPGIAQAMAEAAKIAGVGPMAAVAGAFAQSIAEELVPSETDIIVENGGDLFIRSNIQRTIGIFAGESPFSNRIALVIKPEQTPVGICTSAGTVGPSLSFGQADAAVILAPSTLLADAVATAIANTVQGPEDVESSANRAAAIPGITGALVIAGDKMAAWGDIELCPI